MTGELARRLMRLEPPTLRMTERFPKRGAVIRLVGAVPADMHEVWQAGDRRYFSEDPMALLYPERETDTEDQPRVPPHRGARPLGRQSWRPCSDNIVREPNRSPDESDPIDLAAESEFQAACGAIPNGDTRHGQLRALAAKYVNSAKFVKDIAGNPTTAGLDAVSTAIDELLATNDQPARSDVEIVLTAAIGDPAAYLNRAGLPALEVRVKDSILAIKVAAHRAPGRPRLRPRLA